MSKNPIDYPSFRDNSKTTKKEPTYLTDINRIGRMNSQQIHEELKVKLDLALKHNTRLLDENSTLGEINNSLRMEIRGLSQEKNILTEQLDQFLAKGNAERQSFLNEVQIKQKGHEIELQGLLSQISKLHDEKNNIQIEKNKQIEKLKSQHEKNMFQSIKTIKNYQQNSKELYETQIASLRENIADKEAEIQSLQTISKMEKNRLNDTIRSLENQIKHDKQTYNIEVQNLKSQLDNDLKIQRKRLENDKEIELQACNMRIKKIKKDLLQKNQEIDSLGRRMAQAQQLVSIESKHHKTQKQSLLSQISSNEIYAKKRLQKQKDKLEELNRMQVQNIVRLNETYMGELQGEIERLKLLIDAKKEEIREIYQENKAIRDTYNAENNQLKEENTLLRQKIKRIQLDEKQHMQAFKIKMSVLIDSNIQSMVAYYENQMKNLAAQNQQVRKNNAQIKERLYQAIYDYDTMRKKFQIEVSKQKARVQDLKIKLASINLEHKEHIGSLASKVELTSQTIIREADQKERSKIFFEEEKKKFHSLAAAKDKEINDLLLIVENLKKRHEDELNDLKKEKKKLSQEIQGFEEDKLRIREEMEKELKLKDDKLKSIILTNEKELEQIRELEKKNEALTKENIQTRKQLDHITMINESIMKQLGLSKGYIENLQLESSAAIQDEKRKLKMVMGAHEVSLKEFFEQKLTSKQKDIQYLQKKGAEKEEDLRQLIVKYNALQKRLQILLQTQEKMNEFEKKVIELGLDNNLVKNMAELFKRHK